MNITSYFFLLLFICIILLVFGIFKRKKLLIGIAVVTLIGLALFVYVLGRALSTM
ncbi:hypothetical protein EZS27_013127 [termite gut metagenome]|uniref:Uncharacterized protein n=1 Tax=termite gut metagenome TaxID=433724 RepID=A0A5J4RZQ6_9ZZZZ